MLAATVRFGNRAYDWKTMPKSRCEAGRLEISLPAWKMRPEVWMSRPAIARSSVVLPQPERPELLREVLDAQIRRIGLVAVVRHIDKRNLRRGTAAAQIVLCLRSVRRLEVTSAPTCRRSVSSTRPESSPAP